tara:strand:+ start:609 stop:887 length:279 start_codon:yes stop_codon:yes gene_type:complete
MSYGKIIGSTYYKNEDEKQRLRMGGGSWSIKIEELLDVVKDIVYTTEKGIYRINKDYAISRGFIRVMGKDGKVENKLIVPIKHWEFEIKEKI